MAVEVGQRQIDRAGAEARSRRPRWSGSSAMTPATRKRALPTASCRRRGRPAAPPAPAATATSPGRAAAPCSTSASGRTAASGIDALQLREHAVVGRRASGHRAEPDHLRHGARAVPAPARSAARRRALRSAAPRHRRPGSAAVVGKARGDRARQAADARRARRRRGTGTPRAAAARARPRRSSRKRQPKRDAHAAGRAGRDDPRRPPIRSPARSAPPALGVVGDENSVVAAAAGRANIRSMIAAPVAVSRLPVGSSANSNGGPADERAGDARRAAARRPTVARDNGRAGGRARPPPVRPRRGRRRRARPASSSGTATFSSAVIVGSRWNACSTIPIRPAPRDRQRVLAQPAEIGAGDLHPAAGGLSPARRAPPSATTCPIPTGRAWRPSRPRATSGRCRAGCRPRPRAAARTQGDIARR